MVSLLGFFFLPVTASLSTQTGHFWLQDEGRWSLESDSYMYFINSPVAYRIQLCFCLIKSLTGSIGDADVCTMRDDNLQTI